ncbi:MAG: hypothetical protein ACOY3Y_05295 [Acidobacteriota bacterium]
MSGPVWRFEERREAQCDVCLRQVTGVYVEGEIGANRLDPHRALCPACFAGGASMVVSGHRGDRVPGPAYAPRD